jgi:DtxR family Mn-dependent transcriptional regulator
LEETNMSKTASASTACCDRELDRPAEICLRSIAELSVDGPARPALVARDSGLTRTTTRAVVARLREVGLVGDADGGRVALSEHGTRHAEALLRRHRLVETFLNVVLGVTDDRVHEIAELVENGLSQRVEDLIDGALGHPEVDPRGQQIPSPPDGVPVTLSPLSAAAHGDRFRVLDVRDVEVHRRLAGLGIDRGAILDVVQEAADRGSLWVRLRGRQRILTADMVSAVHGEVVATSAQRRESVLC